MFAECLRERVAQLLVVLLESADPVGGGLESAQQRGVGGVVAVRGGAAVWWALVVPWPEPLDLGAEVGLGVEPGPGHAGFAGDGVEA